MDPLSVIKILWNHRWLALPAVILVILMAGYVVFLGPRTYESSALYVMAAPDLPTDRELERHNRLARLNSDNPYLRASDPALIVHVLVAKMSAQSTALNLEAAGLSTDFLVAESPASTMAVTVSAFADTPEKAVATRQWLLDHMGTELYNLQKVNGADDRYLFTALPIDVAEEPVEKVSSRLRSLIVVLGAGVILVIGVVSLAAALDKRRRAASKVQDNAVPARMPEQGANTWPVPAATQLQQLPRRNGGIRPSEHPLPQPAQVSADQSTVEESATVKWGGAGLARPKADAKASAHAPVSPAPMSDVLISESGHRNVQISDESNFWNVYPIGGSSTEEGVEQLIADPLHEPTQVSEDRSTVEEKPTNQRE
jgi:capsular polysaccharide biosynthesis protein